VLILSCQDLVVGREVISGRTGHAEVLQVTFDPSVISYDKLLSVFFATHDPTTLNRQGNDVGTQYRSIIFYHTDDQKALIEKKLSALENTKVFSSPIVTELKQFEAFYVAESYHHDYFEGHQNEPYCNLVINPKLQKFLKIFKEDVK
jgi:peptide-methionine (S)-S-oxide reductase